MTEQRLPQVDNVKTALVAWVIGGHALAGYTAVGGWPYDEVNEVSFTPAGELVLVAVVGPSGMFVIGGFFFLAGLFTPRSLERKGLRRFTLDRMLRLGLPWAATAFLIWPLTMWLAYRVAGHDGSVWWVVTHRYPLFDAGSLWFAFVLLLFSIGYAVWRTLWPADEDAPAPGAGRLVALAAGIAVSSFLVRLWFPAKSGQIFDLHLWQWPQCLAMFLLGLVCARHGWAREIPDRIRRASTIVAVVTLCLVPVLGIAIGITDLAADIGPFLGGWTWQAVTTVIVEGVLVVAGSLWLLGLAQRHLTQHGRFAGACSRAAFPAFVIQGPVLILLALALRPVAAPAEVKAPLVAAAALVGSFWLAWRLVTRAEPARASRHAR
ncbi:MAG: acyltransferase family protein [Actinophytocola sp.]|uniref:acyltransferase family protein n=1 Tax=Actinophytocola sp. TaxID=1872138 RepID=UPI00132B073A|nr:acyltransferase [Actinophytocola sp.]MPZ85198.1 acyltransferase family protein [Actinophytocola sp.]